jgi:hypothetical protein
MQRVAFNSWPGQTTINFHQAKQSQLIEFLFCSDQQNKNFLSLHLIGRYQDLATCYQDQTNLDSSKTTNPSKSGQKGVCIGTVSLQIHQLISILCRGQKVRSSNDRGLGVEGRIFCRKRQIVGMAFYEKPDSRHNPQDRNRSTGLRCVEAVAPFCGDVLLGDKKCVIGKGSTTRLGPCHRGMKSIVLMSKNKVMYSNNYIYVFI